ncbi:MAG: sensor histidine kinase [Ilumatobacteraceae bacterium]
MFDALAHDLCTPLASIKASVSGLRDADIAWTPEQVRNSLSLIEEEADRLGDVVRQLLDSSRLRWGNIVPVERPNLLSDVVTQAVASLGTPSDSVTIDVDDRLIVLADPGLLSRVIVNLVANAVKHGDGSEVRVTAAGRDQRVQLHVADRGPGIPRPQRESVFEPFAQLGGVSGGVGLGLAIAQGFVEAMGGTIVVGDTAGGGAPPSQSNCRQDRGTPSGRCSHR